MNNLPDKIYSVIFSKNKLQCVNTSNGSVVGSYTFAGTISNGPIVTGDRCVVVFDSKKGKIFKLPKFSVVTTFNI